MRSDLQHRNARLLPSQDTIDPTVNIDHAVSIIPLDPKQGSSSPIRSSANEELCLATVADYSNGRPVTSYFEPKNTT